MKRLCDIINEEREFNGIRIGDSMVLKKHGTVVITGIDKTDKKYPTLIFKDEDDKIHKLGYKDFVKTSMDSI